MAEESFDGLINAIQNAFIRVNQMAESQHLDLISQYFDEKNQPICVEFLYPYVDATGESAEKKIRIPKLCLVPISSLKLSEISVDFKVRLAGKVSLKAGESEIPKQVDRLLKNDRDRSFLGYIPSGRRNHEESYANIVLKFQSEDPPEGLMRIQDELIRVTA